MNYMSRWKTCDPANTVLRIQTWLDEIGLDVQRSAVLRTGTCFSSTLTLAGGYLFVNGKGGSEDFCWASAYGELVERLATRALHRFRYMDADAGVSPALVTDCQLVNRAFFDSEQVYRRFGYDTFDYDTALTVQSTFLPRDLDGVRCESFASLLTQEERLVPVSIADVMIGTNGMAFGNDESEADQQALAELCERFANRVVVNERLALPEFPRRTLHPELRATIEELEDRLGLTVRVRDASLGQGLPVISTLVEEPRSGRYFVKFGAHFDPSVATERCLTELFQGRAGDSLGFLRERAYVEDTYWQARNLDSILHNGDGFYPPEHFMQVDEDPCSTWPTNLGNNEEAVQYMHSILGEIGGDVLKRVYATEPGYVVRYVVPGVSELTMCGQDKLRWRSEFAWVREMLPGFGSLAADTMDTVLDFVQHNCEHDMISLLPMLPHALPASSRYRVVTLKVITFLRATLTESVEVLQKMAQQYASHPAHDGGVAQAMALVVSRVRNIDHQGRRMLVELFCEKVLCLPRLRDDDFCARGECSCDKIRAELEVLRAGERPGGVL